MPVGCGRGPRSADRGHSYSRRPSPCSVCSYAVCACRVRRYRGLFTDASEEDHLLSLSVCPRDPRPVCPQRPTFRARVPKARFRHFERELLGLRSFPSALSPF